MTVWPQGAQTNAWPRDRLHQIYVRLGETQPPRGAEDEAIVAELQTMLAELDQFAGTAKGMDRTQMLHTRSIVHSRLIEGSATPADAAAHAEHGTEDALEAFASLRDFAFRGNTTAKSLLGGSAQRLTVLFQWRPDKTPELAAAVEEAMEEYLQLVAPQPIAVSACARLATGLAQMVRGEVGNTLETAAACQRWADQAHALWEELPPGRPEPDPTGEVMEMLGNCAVVAFVCRQVMRNNEVFFRLITRRYEQLEAVLKTIEPGVENLLSTAAAVKETFEAVVFEACTAMIDTLSEDEDDAWLRAVAMRTLIHLLPEDLWDREVDIEQLLGQEAGERPAASELQFFLDRLEAVLIGAALSGFVRDIAAKAEIEDPAELPLPGLWAALAVMHPRPTLSYLTAAVTLGSGEPPDRVEAEMREVLDQLAEVEADPEQLAGLGSVGISAAIWQMHRREWPDPESLRTEVWNLLERHCIPVLRLNGQVGSRMVAFVFLSAAEIATDWDPADLRVALGWFDDAEKLLDGEPAEGPVLDLARAEVAFALASRDHRVYLIAHAAARAVVDHIDAGPDLPDDGTAYGFDVAVRALRLLGASEQVLRQLKWLEPEEDGIELAIRRLGELAEDPRADGSNRALARRRLAEMEALRMVHGTDHSQISSLEWESLLHTRSVLLLLGLLQADDEVIAGFDPDLIQRALMRTIEQARELGTVGATEGAYLEALAGDDARTRLGISPSQSIALARVSAEVLDPSDPGAAAIALAIVVHLGSLFHDRTVETDYRELAEDIAERFLPTVVCDLPEGTLLSHFLRVMANLTHHLGATRPAEDLQRLGVAMAAHLLAVRSGDIDLAGITAYTASEGFRLSHMFEDAEAWFALHDEWRAAGALADPRYLEFREAIEYDRWQLQRAVAQISGGATDDPAAVSLSDEQDSLTRLARLATEVQANSNLTLDRSDEAALAGAADLDSAPHLLLYQWAVTLLFCARASPSHPRRELLKKVTADVGRQLLTHKLPTPSTRTAALPVLETLVEAAVMTDQGELAQQALNQLAASLGKLFLSAELGPRFLSLRPNAGSLRKAALRAFEKVELDNAIEAAETGRMKLLSSLAAGALEEADSVLAGPQRVPPALAVPVAKVLDRPDLRSIERIVRSDLDKAEFVEVIEGLVFPWVRLATSQRGVLAGSEIPDDLWNKALIEPTIGWLFSALRENEMLVYPFISDAFIGAAVLTHEHLFSFLHPIEGPAEGRLPMGVGAELKRTIRDHLEGLGVTRDDWDTRFVAWDPGTQRTVQKIATGFWMGPLLEETAAREPEYGTPEVPILMPTSRLLAGRARRSAEAPASVAFLGDPTLDLPGPWIEAIAWSAAFGSRLQPHLGAAAVRDAALAGLCESDLVVISGHTFGRAGDDGFGLQLADGTLSHLDLFEVAGEVRATTVILSCCSAASLSRSVATEMIGLGTTLLALGVERVLAPLVPIADRPSSVIGSRLAAPIAAGADLTDAFVEVGRHCLSFTPTALPTTLPESWRAGCPHQESVLEIYPRVDRRELADTLEEFSIFGA